MNILRNKLPNTVLTSSKKPNLFQIAKANESQFTAYLKYVFANSAFGLLKLNSFVKQKIEGYSNFPNTFSNIFSLTFDN